MPTSTADAARGRATGVRGDGWQRRGAGIIVLAALLVVLIVVAAVRDRRLPGEPTAAPVAAAPQVGDCIQEDPHGRDPDLYPAKTPFAALRSGDCSAPRFGEVVSMAPGYPDGIEVPNTAIEQCFQQAYSYLGLPAPPLPLELPVGPAVSVWFVVVGPDDRQRAAGQDWSACVVFLPVSIDAAAPITVDHSLRGAWDRPEDSRLFGVCLNEVDSMIPANCLWWHRFEVISFSPGDPAASPESVQSECTRDVVAALGSPAALDRGEISVLVVPARPDPTGNRLLTGPAAVTAETGYVNNCMLSPTDTGKLLTASVRGLQDAPAPLN
jgi:hypothetical protein